MTDGWLRAFRGALGALALAVAMTVSSSFIATAYGPPWGGIEGTGVTATGVKLPAGVTNRAGPYVVAVDPSVVPLGTLLKINPNPFGDPNIVFTAQDTGGAIKGNRIDFFDPLGRSHQNAWGRRPVSVSVVGHGTRGVLPAQSSSSAAGAPLPSAAGSSSSSGASAGGGVFKHIQGDALKLLLDAVFVGLGAAFVFKGSRRALGQGKAAS